MSHSLFAPAKINLYLNITGKRDDGFHLLDSLCAFTTIGDRITIEPAKELSLTLTGRFAWGIAHDDIRTNLVWRAAEALADHLKRKPNVAITLEKNIPAGAGLGGGSSDAAATIKGLLEYWNTTIAPEDLKTILQSLGSDVSACYEATPLIMRGVGDVILPAPTLPALHLVLVYPNKPSSTPAAYKAFKGPFSQDAAVPASFGSVNDLVGFLKTQVNDLCVPAVQSVPEIDEVLTLMREEDGILLPQMSGSGSACFGIFKTDAHAERAAESLSRSYPEWWVQRGGLLSQR
jgi:4-diphosphocytidyl-2-C-methyl-D-erythritol kinase